MLRFLSPRRILLGALIVGASLAVIRFLAVQGWIRPVRVVSGSMVDSLIGEHFKMTCADCKFPFAYGVESLPRGDYVACPNCGYQRNRGERAVRGRGDRVMIDRAAYWFEPPRRLDLVAFRDPRLPVRKVVKRVVALPGERPVIRHGDLYINGSIFRKSLAEFHRVALLVHDNAYSPPAGHLLPARWRSEREESGWQAAENGFRFLPPVPFAAAPADFEQPRGDQDRGQDWLVYHHWRGYANPYPRGVETPVADNYGYNQGESRELREVSDLFVRFQLHGSADTVMELRVHDGRQWCMARVSFAARAVELRRADQTLGTGELATAPEMPVELEFGVLDQQLVLGLAGQEIARVPYEPGKAERRGVANPMGIRVLEGEARVTDLLVRRDVHYLDPWLVGRPWELSEPLAEDAYLVLGDNPPLSDDCRHWEQPFLLRSAILGRVLPLPR